eukprot:c9174_g1_i1.p1 GENE.c9174_g1_i1~~c9174_g1_i1.p1  ORF type:complete len:173 (-),score=34.15 c9174_g1_i1:111-629(-)
MSLSSLLLLAFAVAAALAQCPGSPVFMHAKCDMSVTFPTTACADISEEIVLRGNATNGWYDPHNNGTYTIVSATNVTIEATRLTGDGKYTDRMLFTMSNAGAGCSVSACSESQVNSIYDYSTNYCNLRDLYCGKDKGCKFIENNINDYTEKFNSCTYHTESECLTVASSVVA